MFVQSPLTPKLAAPVAVMVPASVILPLFASVSVPVLTVIVPMTLTLPTVIPARPTVNVRVPIARVPWTVSESIAFAIAAPIVTV